MCSVAGNKGFTTWTTFASTCRHAHRSAHVATVGHESHPVRDSISSVSDLIYLHVWLSDKQHANSASHRCEQPAQATADRSCVFCCKGPGQESRLHRDAGQPRYFVGCHCAPLSSRFLRMVGCLALVARYLPRLPEHGTGEVRQHARVLIKLTQAVGPTVKQTAQAVARVYANRPVIRDSELSLCDSTYCYPTTNSPAFPPNRSLAAASAPRSLRPRPGRSVCGTRFRGGRQGWGAACLKCGTPVCSLLALLPHTPPCPFPHPPVTPLLALRLSFSRGQRLHRHCCFCGRQLFGRSRVPISWSCTRHYRRWLLLGMS